MDPSESPNSGKKRRASLAGTNLFLDVRTGIYVWRRVDEATGRRFKRSTGSTNLSIALKTARGFEEEYQLKKAGMAAPADWSCSLRPLAEEWIASQRGEVGDRFLPQKEMRILRALEDLDLRTAADLDNVARVHDRLMRLEREGKTRSTLRRCYQETLKQFAAWLAENKRYLDRNPLATWKPIKIAKPGEKPRKKRRALLPDEVARAFLACERLDEAYNRTESPRRTFLLLLVTGSRPGALLSRDVEHLDAKARRIDLGPSVGKKRRGVGALDEKTATELTNWIGKRTTDTLLLSPDGTRPTIERLRDHWREAFSLALLDALWPKDEPHDLGLALLVNRSFLSNRVRAFSGGPPPKRAKTVEKRSKLERKIEELMDATRLEWSKRMAGVDVYALRKTHRTWAELRGVPAVLIDKQLGHAGASTEGAGEFLRLLQGSETGRKHYLDMDLELFDASRSAHEVRTFLEEAISTVEASESFLVKAPKPCSNRNGGGILVKLAGGAPAGPPDAPVSNDADDGRRLA
jgi:integrase